MKIFNCKIPDKIKFAILLGLLFFTFQVEKSIAQTKSADNQISDGLSEKIHISADKLISNTPENNAEFIGNVRAIQGKTLITADRLQFFFNGSTNPGDNPSAQSLERLVASGNVIIKFDNRLAVATRAVYITAKRLLTLTGPDATVTSGENTISGETISFYRDDGRFTVDGGSNGRVKAVIMPGESGLE